MNHIEAAADRLLPDVDGGAIRPLDMAVGRSPVLTGILEAAAHTTWYLCTTYGPVRPARAVPSHRPVAVGDLLESRSLA